MSAVTVGRPVDVDDSAATRRRRPPPSGARVAAHVVLLVGVVLSLFPFYWLLVMATSTTSEIYAEHPRLYPGTQFFHNFGEVLAGSTFARAFVNSVLLTAGTTALTLFLSSLAGYVFAKRVFPGRDALFAFLLLTLLLPTGVALVPNYQIYATLGWLNTFLPLIVPGAVTAFGVFWMRQAADAAVYTELIEAATVDGAGFFRTYLSVAVPAMRPSLIAFGIFNVIWTWNDYLWPLLVLGDPNTYTLPVALAQVKGSYGYVDYSVVMAGTLVATVPLIVLFLALRRTVMENVNVGAVKG